MADSVKKAPAKWETTRYRVLPQEGRGGDRFAVSVPADDNGLDRLRRGESPNAIKMVKVRAGEVIERLPAESLAWLIARGYVVPADGPDDPYRKAPAKAVDE